MASAKGAREKKETMKTKTNLRPTSGSRSVKSASSLRSQLDVLSKENKELKSCLTKTEEQNLELKEKLRSLTYEIIDSSNKAEKQLEFDPNMDVVDIPLDELKSLIAMLSTSHTKAKSSLFETRIEEVETRITLLSGELGKLVKLKLKVQNGLQGIISCSDLEDAKKQARQLWIESCATDIFVEPVSEKKETPKHRDDVDNVRHPIIRNCRSASLPYAIAINLQKVEISPVSRKLPANTHITDMSENLTKLIVQELSLYKGSGADWRMLAKRVGIVDTMIKQWEAMKIAQPMKNVLCVWGESPGATVRMLHRHLISPQMRKVILAKRISDHYIVD
ncbi:desmoplakin-like [Gigantopelta aegis]|uniref:desmoplakin-like n=1 Tax=Gigantopelta aegis TaxID=1735272 RepID=UPI001B88C4F3|nr:desmoplakin-like [Gigantopelta aegis]